MNTIELAMKEYNRYYNICSDWICNNLMTPIGSLYQYIDDKCKNNAYAQNLIAEEWKDKPLYYMFYKGYNANNCANAICCAIRSQVPEVNKAENILNLSYTYYFRNGVIKSVISNYASKMRILSDKQIKYCIVSENTPDKILIEQCILELKRRHEDLKDWEENLKYLILKGNESAITRFTILKDFYSKNIERVKEEREIMAIAELKDFGGCRRKDDKLSMCIQSAGNSKDIKVSRVKTTHNYTELVDDYTENFNIKFSALDFNVMGRRDVVKTKLNKTEDDSNTWGGTELLVDIINNHGCSLTFKLVDDKLYVDIPIDTEHINKTTDFKKSVGIDVNLKHSLLNTDILDNGGINGYINIYKKLLADDAFMSACTKADLVNYIDIAKTVTFCPIEADFIISNVVEKYLHMKDNTNKMEIAFSSVLMNIRKELEIKLLHSSKEESPLIRKQIIYINCIICLRNELKQYAIAKHRYYKKQQEYDTLCDTLHGVDYKQIHPYAQSKEGAEQMKKMKTIENNLIANRNNIIEYAYTVFELNNFDLIALENITKDIMEDKKKRKSFPSINSLLKYHKVINCTEDNINDNETYQKFAKYYNVSYENGKVTGATLSQEGNKVKLKDDFYDKLLKVLHFTSIKDYFTTLSNKRKIAVAHVPAYYTSQIDSIDNKICMIKSTDKNGKSTYKIADKTIVRPTQEKHINGLNADYNAARNINFIVADEKWRKKFVRPTNTNKPLYNSPVFSPAVKSEGGTIKNLQILSATKTIIL